MLDYTPGQFVAAHRYIVNYSMTGSVRQCVDLSPRGSSESCRDFD